VDPYQADGVLVDKDWKPKLDAGGKEQKGNMYGSYRPGPSLCIWREYENIARYYDDCEFTKKSMGYWLEFWDKE